jgi:hypothetical protein
MGGRSLRDSGAARRLLWTPLSHCWTSCGEVVLALGFDEIRHYGASRSCAVCGRRFSLG